MTDAMQEGSEAAQNQTNVPRYALQTWHENLRRAESEMIHVKAISMQVGAFNNVADFMNSEREALQKLINEINTNERDPLFKVQAVFQLGKEAFEQLNLQHILNIGPPSQPSASSSWSFHIMYLACAAITFNKCLISYTLPSIFV